MPTDPLADAIAEAAMDDPEMQAAVRQLAIMAIRKTKHFLERGSPQVQMQILRSFIPALIREMNKSGDDDTYGDLKNEFESLRKEMLQGVEGADET